MSLRRYFHALTNPQIRQRIAPLVLVGGGVVLWSATQEHVPRSQDVSVSLPASAKRAEIRRVRLTYTRDGEAVGGVTRSFQGNAPSELHHTIALTPGQYELSVAIDNEDGSANSFEKALSVPSDGTLHIRLPEPPP